MTNEERKETKDLAQALLAWLHSQEARPQDAVVVFLDICGSIIGDTAKSFPDCLRMKAVLDASAWDCFFRKRNQNIDKM